MHIETEILNQDIDTMDYARRKHAKGFRLLGTGLYSAVYGSDATPYVVKIFKGHDKGYRNWIRTLAEVENLRHLSKYVPKIYQVFLYRRPDEFYKNTGLDIGYSSQDTMVVYLEPLTGKDTPYVNPKENDYQKRRKTSLARFAEKVTECVDKARCSVRPDWGNLRPVHRDLVSLILLAYEKNRATGIDIHYGNVMKRGRQVVITDPLSGG
jgi:hypothetical protein